MLRSMHGMINNEGKRNVNRKAPNEVGMKKLSVGENLVRIPTRRNVSKFSDLSVGNGVTKWSKCGHQQVEGALSRLQVGNG